jgi:YHS domain-containing protein
MTTAMENNMERDVVCGMEVDPKSASAKTERNGRTYYFCCEQCKKQFDADPAKYGA